MSERTYEHIVAYHCRLTTVIPSGSYRHTLSVEDNQILQHALTYLLTYLLHALQIGLEKWLLNRTVKYGISVC